MEANLDSRTEALAIGTIDQFYDDGGTLPVVFESSHNINSWGVAAPTFFNDNTPKQQAAASIEALLPPTSALTFTALPKASPSPVTGTTTAPVHTGPEHDGGDRLYLVGLDGALRRGPTHVQRQQRHYHR